VPEGRLSDGVQVKLSPVWPDVIVETVLRASAGPSFRVMVTGPVASAQVIVKGSPASIPLKSSLVRMTLAAAKPARMIDEMVNFILIDFV